MNRVIFINRFYWPETPATGQLLTDLASELASRGLWRVTVITSRRAGDSLPRIAVHRGVEIIRVRTSRSNRTNIIAKAIAFAAFALGALGTLMRLAKRADVVVTMTDPPMLGMLTGFVARCKSAKVVHWIQDIYPEVAVALSGQHWLNALAPWRNAAWRHADHCVTIGRDMGNVVRAARVSPRRLSIVPNWAPVGLHACPPGEPCIAQRRRDLALENAFIVGYSGNLGRVHELSSVLGAAERLRENSRICFLISGHGAQKESLEEGIARASLTNVRFFPPAPRDELASALGLADVHLVTLRAGCEAYVFPSKLYGIAAVGRPVVFVGPVDSEIAGIVRDAGLGLVVGSGDSAGLAAAIESLAQAPESVHRFSAASLRFAAETSLSSAAESWVQILQTVHAC